jgi:short-subunit dehydrogenase
MTRILIVGANSAIAQATARLWATTGARMIIVARDLAHLDSLAADLKVRGATDIHTIALDINERERHDIVLRQAFTALDGIDVALIAHGSLPDQRECERSIELAVREFDINGTRTIELMARLANLFEHQGSGMLAVISSVAGDRGRAGNAIYGAAKSAVTTYASALRQRLRRANVHVLTIKPGFVDTPMTERFAKGMLWAKPAGIASGIVRAVACKRNVVYLPWFWRPVMAVIRLLPESLFSRLGL